ncbi:hypothetical protein ELS19_04510 [Halogeometricum borinquense]|uniref:Uncharacterized protein n=1 Tax=Halogeometricum borinquense TaxID=60847 RepID=A0A482T6I8_9EURY|nr:hypothetical protein [Halogeometricum borinquense]RYJ13300.1 hypothetical protein ELS19_04510 [Halogeometricum borinquense]
MTIVTEQFQKGRDERDYVEECPMCGVALIGMSPEEYREEHDCDPLNVLIVFPERRTNSE